MIDARKTAVLDRAPKQLWLQHALLLHTALRVSELLALDLDQYRDK
ncbi:MAG TPA: hypothetical protein VKU02_28900 [Gemmataceae bacterium]|nr:hypothetical protein [Gemmataceae bacterium]